MELLTLTLRNKVGGSFMFSHSTISKVSAFSVFHQLHCIVRKSIALCSPHAPNINTNANRKDTLRHTYYKGLASDYSHSASVHVAHCFDYLRQCVECSADTILEPVEWELGEIDGRGVGHFCRDNDGVKRYAEKWRASWLGR